LRVAQECGQCFHETECISANRAAGRP
jgi:hypothetical protein